MSADSGLPVFRGNEGFWGAYPRFRKLNISFQRMAQPYWFVDKPRMAWAWYGHRHQLYRSAQPHAGYGVLRQWSEVMIAGSFVVTSNVDGQFSTAGFSPDALVEQHGSLHRLQCTKPCSDSTWEASDLNLQIDLELMEAQGELPQCPACGALARPNVLMFNDATWVRAVTKRQVHAFDYWLASVRGQRLVIVEIGAGTAVPTIRNISERVAERQRTTLVRINPDAVPDVDPGVAIRLPAEQALRLLEQAVPDSFRNRYGKPIARRQNTPTVSVAPASAALDVQPSKEVDSVEFVDTSKRDPKAPEPAAGRIRIRLDAVTDIELSTGQIEMVDPLDITDEEEMACLTTWMSAQSEFVPLPSCYLPNLKGYTMTARVLRSPEVAAGATPGAALVLICGPAEEVILTAGISRRAVDGSYLWRMLHERTETALQPLDYPREPWVARFRDPASVRHVAVLPQLTTVIRAIAVSWLRFQAFLEHESQKKGN